MIAAFPCLGHGMVGREESRASFRLTTFPNWQSLRHSWAGCTFLLPTFPFRVTSAHGSKFGCPEMSKQGLPLGHMAALEVFVEKYQLQRLFSLQCPLFLKPFFLGCCFSSPCTLYSRCALIGMEHEEGLSSLSRTLCLC